MQNLFANSNFRRDALRALRQFKYEETPDGLLLPGVADGAICAAHYETQALRAGVLEPWEVAPNKVPTEGLNNALSVWLDGGTQVTNHYLALFSGDVVVAASWTGANFHANATEIGAAYTEGTRVLWVKGDPANGVLDNTASAAVFTFNTGVTVRGIAMLTTSTKQDTVGKLISASRLASDKAFVAAEELRAKLVMTATSP